MGWLKNILGRGTTEPSADSSQEETFRAVGCCYYQEHIQQLAESNPDWRRSGKALAAEGKVMQRIYRYAYIHKPVKLLAEPKNPYDKNAVLIQIAGEPVGHIPAEDAAHVKEIISRRNVEHISAQIFGGPYKVISANGDAEKLDSELTVKVKIRYR